MRQESSHFQQCVLQVMSTNTITWYYYYYYYYY